MAALLIQTSSFVPPFWLWASCLLTVALIPSVEWLARVPQRRRVVVMLAVAMFAATALVSAAEYPIPEWCCPDYVAYGLCWPIGWWPC